MDPMAMLALATVVFLATHYVSSTPLRSGLVALLGENTYLVLYTFVSLVTLAWMIWAYVKAPYERLWVGDEFKAWAVVLMPARSGTWTSRAVSCASRAILSCGGSRSGRRCI